MMIFGTFDQFTEYLGVDVSDGNEYKVAVMLYRLLEQGKITDEEVRDFVEFQRGYVD